jgi:MFS transporter, DHA2 family, methylenomycin A resistance protein
MPAVKTTMTRAPTAFAPTASASGAMFAHARARYALYAICLGFFLVLLDTTALNVAVAAIQRGLGGTIGSLQWVVNSYTIVFASFLLTAGAIGDRLGSKRLYQLGLALFTGMSLACALSPGVGFLVGARMLQGLGAAILLPASLALLSHAFPDPDERARAVAFWAGVVSLGFAAGPALGGILTTFFGWRSIFLLNVPVGLLAFGMVLRFVDESKVAHPRPIEWTGQLLACLVLFFLAYGLIEAGGAGWGAPRVLVAFALAVLLGLGFGLVEGRSTSPVLPRSLFQQPTFAVSVTIGAVLNFSMYGILFIESIYLQNVRHLTALSTGLTVLPFTVLPTITTRLIIGYSARKYIRWRLAAGLMVAAAGAGVLGLSLASAGYGEILLGLGFLGVGMGCIMPAMTAGVLTSSPAETSGLASGILNSARQVGGAVGVALMGTLVQRGHQQGLLGSFALTAGSFLLMALVTLRAIKPDPAAA